VRQICDRAIVLDHGRMVGDAAPGEAVRVFRETLAAHGALDTALAGPSSDVSITNVAIEHPGLLVGRSWLLPDESLTVRVSYRAAEPTDDLLIAITVDDANGYRLFATDSTAAGAPPPRAEGDCEACFAFERVPLLDGAYALTITIRSARDGSLYDRRERRGHFAVMNPTRAAGLVSLPVEVRFGASTPAKPTGK
jgi:ABC-2 type transport system ATP-binding protein